MMFREPHVLPSQLLLQIKRERRGREESSVKGAKPPLGLLTIGHSPDPGLSINL
jgi:hypothetical protein